MLIFFVVAIILSLLVSAICPITDMEKELTQYSIGSIAGIEITLFFLRQSMFIAVGIFVLIACSFFPIVDFVKYLYMVVGGMLFIMSGAAYVSDREYFESQIESFSNAVDFEVEWLRDGHLRFQAVHSNQESIEVLGKQVPKTPLHRPSLYVPQEKLQRMELFLMSQGFDNSVARLKEFRGVKGEQKSESSVPL